MDLYEYIEANKDFTFFEKGMTEVDMLLFSQLPYVLMDNIDFENDKSYTIEKLYPLIDQTKKKKYIFSQIHASNIYDKINKTKRYKDIKVFNYEYVADLDMQFSALQLELPTKERIVCFEGTDNTIAGWKEDASLAYQYPITSQVLAGIYLNNTLNNYKGKIHVCGHSKGGNLALVGCMRLNIFKKHRIIDIYSFDGPGLKESEFRSFRYKLIRKKLYNIVPEMSFVGVLLEQEKLIAVKSKEKGFFQHSAVSWLSENDRFIRTKQNNLSIELDKVVTNWLKSYSYEEREIIVDNLFHIVEEANIFSVSDINIKTLSNVLRASKSLDKKTKQIVFKGVRVLVGDIGIAFVSDGINKVKNFFKG